MRINIEQLRKKESVDSINFDFTITPDKLDSEQINAIGAEEIEFIKIWGDITPKSSIEINSIIAINYKIEAKFTAKCARCDETIVQEIYTSGEKYLADRLYDNDKDKEDDESFYMIEANVIELAEFAMEFLELEVPIRYLCSDDCKGLCSKCGKNLNEGECDCPKKEKNPAFKILDNFFN